jgi:hypothetical protein
MAGNPLREHRTIAQRGGHAHFGLKNKVKEQTDIGKSAHCSETLAIIQAQVAIADRQNQSDAEMVRIGGWDLQRFRVSNVVNCPSASEERVKCAIDD